MAHTNSRHSMLCATGYALYVGITFRRFRFTLRHVSYFENFTMQCSILRFIDGADSFELLGCISPQEGNISPQATRCERGYDITYTAAYGSDEVTASLSRQQ